MKMNRFDLTPLYRSTIGFDRLASLFDTVQTRLKKARLFRPIMSNVSTKIIIA
jgi:hypothetical protein